MSTITDPPLPAALLSRAHSPSTSSTINKSQILHRPLLLRPSSPDPASTNPRTKRQYLRRQKSHRKPNSDSKPHPLSARQTRSLSLHTIPKPQQNHAIYEPLHKLWCAYMRDILSLSTKTFLDPTSAGPILVSADYHGAKVTVVRSKCVSRVGISGIVVRDTKFTFEIVVRGDGVKVLPKEGTLFRIEVPFEEEEEGIENGEGGGSREKRQPLVFDIFGDRFMSRAPERANKKFKGHIVDL